MFNHHISQDVTEKSRDKDGSHFRCPDCGPKGQRETGPNAMNWNNRINNEMKPNEEHEKRSVRMVTEEERRKIQQANLIKDIPSRRLPPGNFSSSPHSWRETFSERPEILADSYSFNVESKNMRYEQCESCHRTYRAPELAISPGRTDTSTRDAALFNGFPPKNRVIDRGRNGTYNPFDMINTELKRESRNVTFDLESLRTLDQAKGQGKDKRVEGVRTSRDKRHKAKIQPSHLLKVKLNLNPLRKSKVHPNRKNEQDHSEKSSSKKSNEKRQNIKERREKEGRAKSGKKSKSSSEKLKKSTKSKTSSKDGRENREGEEGKGRMIAEHNKTLSEGDTGGQEGMAGDKGEKTQPDPSQGGDTSSTADQSASAAGQAQNSQGGHGQYQGAGLDLASALVLPQYPFSSPVVDRNITSSLSLLGSAGSQLTGGNLSLPGGNFLLNTMAPGLNTRFPSGPANSVPPGIAINGPNLSSSSVLGSFNRQTGESLKALASSLLGNPGMVQSAPLHYSQAGGLALNLAANPTLNPEPSQSLFQNQLLSDSSLLLSRLNPDPAKGTALQEVSYQLPLESRALQSKESLPAQLQVPPNAETLSVVPPQALGSVSSLENLPNNNQAESVGSAENMLADMLAAAPTEGAAEGMTEGSTQAADTSLPGAGGSSTDDADTAVLLHQEYLPEEGDSSPRRKLRLALPEKTSSRPLTALERKIR